ncbi:MAG: YggU family protein [Nitrospirae bacterium]|nr:YggU family protein [Nitrospirota bacterium]
MKSLGIKIALKAAEDGVIIPVRVQPRTSRSEIGDIQNGMLKIRLTAPPVEGEANAQCIQIIAKWLGVPKGRISILQGEKSREKKIKIEGITVDKVLAKLE